MNIWGYQQQIKRTLRFKDYYLQRPRNQLNPEFMKAMDRATARRKNLIEQLRIEKDRKKKR